MLRLCASWGDRGPPWPNRGPSHFGCQEHGISALGHEQTYSQVRAMSALPSLTGRRAAHPSRIWLSVYKYTP